MAANDTLADDLVAFLVETRDKLRAELTAQGHVLTGKTRDSIEYKISVDGSSIFGFIQMDSLGLIINAGVPASKIPYQRGSGRKTSKYISGLISFFILRGLSSINARGAAFATANVQKREGNPTRGSYSYSRNGERKNFIPRGLSDVVGAAQNIITKYQNEFSLEIVDDLGFLFGQNSNLEILEL